jgi:flagellar biosynthesis protein FlhB
MARGGTKTEKPTPQRLRKAREQGQFLVSRGFLNAIQFSVALVLLGKVVGGWDTSLSHSLPRLLERSIASELGESEWPLLVRGIVLENLSPILLFSGALFMATLTTQLAISKLGFSLHRLAPSLGRLSPASRLKSLPSQNLKVVVEAVLLLVALSFVINALVQQNGAALLRLPLESVRTGAGQVGESIQSLLWKAAALFLAFGVIDLMRQQRKHMSEMRMSKEEVREENKRTDGDPQMKARIRRLRRDLLRKRMMQDVAKATAVVVNPTHFAVAIRYEMDSMASPMVVAKGKNWLAIRIRQIATQNHIPIIENPPLARALYDAVEVGRAISPEFYKAIAEILAYVYRIMGRSVAR